MQKVTDRQLTQEMADQILLEKMKEFEDLRKIINKGVNVS